MSLVPLEVEVRGDGTVLVGPDGWTLPLTPGNAAKVRRATTRRVVLGARHSTIRLHDGQHPGTVPGRVYNVEPTGDVTFVQVSVGEAVVNVSLDPTVRVATDETVWVEFDQARMHLFDADTTLALRAGD
jgi:multiple sugar transport system ATP-binding protein